MYERRLLEAEQASFMPLVFTTTGGMDANVYDIIARSIRRGASNVKDKDVDAKLARSRV